MTIYKGLTYLDKHRFLPRQISVPPHPSLDLIIAIPCHDEFHLDKTLESLEACQAIPASVEVIIVINAGKHHPAEVHHQNEHTLHWLKEWIKASSRKLTYHAIYVPNLPRKHAGVGLARKIAMDEAVDRFTQTLTGDGIIVCLDADSTVDDNYLKEIYRVFNTPPYPQACNLHFEHPLSGNTYSPDVYEGIAYYELFLRYYIQGLRYAGFPYAYHTIGSSMAVTSQAYQQKGGMNRRKAGEDFYFLHKFIPGGRFTEIHSTTVFPSPRPSQKVPFGTGRAINDWLSGAKNLEYAYALQSFQDLKELMWQVPGLFDHPLGHLPESISTFLENQHFNVNLEEIRQHVASRSTFCKRFFQWFDALKVLKYIHFVRDEYYRDEPLLQVAKQLYQLERQQEASAHMDIRKWLTIYRRWQKSNGGYIYPPSKKGTFYRD